MVAGGEDEVCEEIESKKMIMLNLFTGFGRGAGWCSVSIGRAAGQLFEQF